MIRAAVTHDYCVCVLSQREQAVRDMLTLHCPLQETDESVHRERFLTERLLVPEQWIHEAKATRARHNADRHLEALHLYRAGYWNQCHQLLIQHLASGAGSADQFHSLHLFPVKKTSSNTDNKFTSEFLRAGKSLNFLFFCMFLNLLSCSRLHYQRQPRLPAGVPGGVGGP